MVVFDVFCYGFVHRSVRSQANQRGRYRHHVGKLQERSVGQFCVSFCKHLFCVFKKPLIAVGVALASFSDLSHHGLFVPHVVEAVAIAPNQAVHRLDLHEVQVILQLPVRQLEQFGERVRCRDDRWASVKREPLVFVYIRSTARQVPGFVEDGFDAS